MTPEPATLSYARPSPPRSHGAAFLRAVGVVAASAVLLAVGGGLLGLFIGWVSPGYYRAVFRTADPAFEPMSVGFAMGVGQGAAAGLLVGVALAFILAWRETRVRPLD